MVTRVKLWLQLLTVVVWLVNTRISFQIVEHDLCWACVSLFIVTHFTKESSSSAYFTKTNYHCVCRKLKNARQTIISHFVIYNDTRNSFSYSMNVKLLALGHFLITPPPSIHPPPPSRSFLQVCLLFFVGNPLNYRAGQLVMRIYYYFVMKLQLPRGVPRVQYNIPMASTWSSQSATWQLNKANGWFISILAQYHQPNTHSFTASRIITNKLVVRAL